MRDLDMSQVARRSGVPASTLRYYEEKGLIASIGRRGLRRLFDPGVLERLALVGLGQAAGFSLDEIARMFGTDGRPRIDRAALSAKADELDRLVVRLRAMSDGLRHAAGRSQRRAPFSRGRRLRRLPVRAGLDSAVFPSAPCPGRAEAGATIGSGSVPRRDGGFSALDKGDGLRCCGAPAVLRDSSGGTGKGAVSGRPFFVGGGGGRRSTGLPFARVEISPIWKNMLDSVTLIWHKVNRLGKCS